MTKVTIRRTTEVQFVSTTNVFGQQIDITDEHGDAYDALITKIEAVSELLDCSLEEAERLVLRRPGCSA